MKINIVSATSCLVLSLLCVSANAQTYTETIGIRLQAGGVLSLHSADLTKNADVLNCGQHSTGQGIGLVGQLGIDVPLSSRIDLGISLGYVNRSGTFSTTNTYPARDPLTGSDQPVSTDLTLNTQLSFLEVQTDVRIPIFSSENNRLVRMVVGPRIALPLGSRFVQSEQIVSPSDATFIVDSKRYQDRTIQDQAFTTRSSVLVGGSVGIEIVKDLSPRTSLTTQLSADYFFNNVVIDSPWKIFGIRAEVGLRFSLGTTSVPEEPAPAPPMPVQVEPTIVFTPLKIVIETSKFAGQVVTGNVLLATAPIVNAVFFDSASVAIPSTYRLSHDGSKISADPVAAHGWLLPRIAKIVQDNPEALVQLHGASSNQGEGENLATATGRVQNVRDALVRLGIESARITTTQSINPRLPSNAEFSGGRAENRRVDISVLNAPLQQWVNTEKFAELRGSMNVFAKRFGGDPKRNLTAAIQITIGDTDTTISPKSTASELSFVVPITTTQTTAKISTMATSDDAVAMRDTTVELSSLPRRVIALQADQFEACLRFEYNSSELTAEVKDLLRQLVERLPTGSEISILGSADILGSEGRNKKLSELRASNTEQYIRSLSSNKFKVQVGTKDTKLSDSTPQGRFLNRSIWITVKTPE